MCLYKQYNLIKGKLRYNSNWSTLKMQKEENERRNLLFMKGGMIRNYSRPIKLTDWPSPSRARSPRLK